MKVILKCLSLAVLSSVASFAQVAVDREPAKAAPVHVRTASDSSVQDRFEVFGGYSYHHISYDLGNGSKLTANTNGWATSFTAYPLKHLGVTADFSGDYIRDSFTGSNVPLHLYTYMFGPTLPIQTSGMRSHNIKLFARALVGSSTAGYTETNYKVSSSYNVHPFAAAGGGGMDYRISEHVSIRPLQADYIYYRQAVGNTHVSFDTFRYTPGVVFSF